MTGTDLLSYSSDGAWIALPPPSVYSCVPQDIYKHTGRNVAGDLCRTYVATKRTITLEWHGVSPSVKDSVVAATTESARPADIADVTGLGSVFGMSFRYWDPATASVREGLFYRGTDLRIDPLVRWDRDGSEFVAYDVAMSLVEV